MFFGIFGIFCLEGVEVVVLLEFFVVIENLLVVIELRVRSVFREFI